MVENHETVYCIFYPTRVSAGRCPEDCLARFYCAMIKSAIKNQDATSGTETLVTEELAKRISKTRGIRKLARQLIASGRIPSCASGRKNKPPV